MLFVIASLKSQGAKLYMAYQSTQVDHVIHFKAKLVVSLVQFQDVYENLFFCTVDRAILETK